MEEKKRKLKMQNFSNIFILQLLPLPKHVLPKVVVSRKPKIHSIIFSGFKYLFHQHVFLLNLFYSDVKVRQCIILENTSQFDIHYFVPKEKEKSLFSLSSNTKVKEKLIKTVSCLQREQQQVSQCWQSWSIDPGKVQEFGSMKVIL